MTRAEIIRRKKRARRVTNAIGIAEAAGVFGVLYLVNWMASMV